MKARESALRLKRFEADEMARKVADLEHMIREFEGMASDLDRQIRAEEERTGVKDPAHFAYSTFAKSAIASASFFSVETAIASPLFLFSKLWIAKVKI